MLPDGVDLAEPEKAEGDEREEEEPLGLATMEECREKMMSTGDPRPHSGDRSFFP